jgi:hypothetical protein
MRKFILSAALLALAACSNNSASNSNQAAFVRGKATVLQVDNNLGMAELNIDGKIVDAYWQTEVYVPQEGTIDNSGNGPFSQAVGNYKEPYSHHIDLPAKVGDTIVFRAMRTGDELLLRSVLVVPN